MEVVYFGKPLAKILLEVSAMHLLANDTQLNAVICNVYVPTTSLEGAMTRDRWYLFLSNAGTYELKCDPSSHMQPDARANLVSIPSHHIPIQ